LRTTQRATPQPELREFVRVFAQREITCAADGFAQANTAVLEQVLAFELKDRMILDFPDGRSKPCPGINAWGSLTYPFGGSRFSGHILAFAIFLKPFASWQLFRTPPGTITNIHCDGADLFGRGMQDLWSRLAECATFSERVRVAEEYLRPYAVNALARTSIMKTAQHMFLCKGAVRIDELAYHASLSVRQYERRFAEEMGLSPKLFARIARFQMALDAKRTTPARSWLSVAHEYGYFDQMHMIRDFQNLGGDTPGQTLQQSGDLQPWSIGSPMAPNELPDPSKRQIFAHNRGFAGNPGTGHHLCNSGRNN
jgi:AraC-like DNA-binding protein